MGSHKQLGPLDSPFVPAGDFEFIGLNMQDKPWLLAPGFVQKSENKRFDRRSGRTRPGTITPVHANIPTYGTIYGSGVYSNPNDSDAEYLALVVADGVWMTRMGRYPTKIALDSGLSVTDEVDLIQCFGVEVMLRGEDFVPLQWDGNFYGEYTAIDQTGSGSTSPIPNSLLGLLFKDFLLVKEDRDSVAVSDRGNYTRYDDIMDEFTFNSGSDDKLTSFVPYTDTAILFFKDQSIFGVTNIYGDLSAIQGFEVSRGGIGTRAKFSPQKWGSKVLFWAESGIWAVLPDPDNLNKLTISAAPLSWTIQPLIDRVNPKYLDKIVSAQTEDYIHWAVPFDGSTYNNAMITMNRRTGHFEAVDTWAAASGFRMDRLHVTDGFGTKQLYAVDNANGRVCMLYNSGAKTDVIGTTEYQISDCLRTRAYVAEKMGFSDFNHVEMMLKTQNPRFTVKAITDGVNEETTLCSARTKNRLKYYTHAKPDFDVTNVNDDFDAPRRQDYLAKSSDGILSNSGVNPNLEQEYTEPFPIRAPGKYCSLEISNNQGTCDVLGIALEGKQAASETMKQVA